jgi:hypothetical protein
MKPYRRPSYVAIVTFLVTHACASAALTQDDANATAIDQPPAASRDTVVDEKPFPTRSLPPIYRLPYTLPGAFAFRTTKGYYLTAIDGGGRYLDPTVITASPTAGPWEQFRIVVNPSSAYDKSLMTYTGNYVTAVNGGGVTWNALHTDATVIGGWEQLRMIDLAESGFKPTWYALYTLNGNIVTATGAGGQYYDPIHTDGYQVGSWEEFHPDKCGDPGSGYEYYIIAADGLPLSADDGGGHADDGAIALGFSFGPSNAQWSRFKLLRQYDGTYALQTANGANYVTALNGGGLVQQYEECDPGWWGACISGFSGIFHTDATQVLGWEKFRIADTGECKYTIQTVSGYYLGIVDTPQGTVLTTDRSVVSNNEKFELVMSGLGSPPIIH